MKHSRTKRFNILQKRNKVVATNHKTLNYMTMIYVSRRQRNTLRQDSEIFRNE